MRSTDGSERTDGLVLRPADESDAGELARIHLAARESAAIPNLHAEDATVAWLVERLRSSDECWVAEVDGAVAGYLRATPSWLDDLYVAPAYAGRGLGSALLDLMKARRPAGFGLYAFAHNIGAQRFYRRHGLVEVARHDGDRNDEGLAEIEWAWLGEDPKAGVRRRIDDVDDRLADLLAERAALTALAQRVRRAAGEQVGAAGRDADRERRIAERMAERAPELGAERLRRVMDAVIVTALEAAREGPREAAPETDATMDREAGADVGGP